VRTCFRPSSPPRRLFSSAAARCPPSVFSSRRLARFALLSLAGTSPPRWLFPLPRWLFSFPRWLELFPLCGLFAWPGLWGDLWLRWLLWPCWLLPFELFPFELFPSESRLRYAASSPSEMTNSCGAPPLPAKENRRGAGQVNPNS